MDGANDEEDPVVKFAKLPLPEKVVHKNWKVRDAAYKELTKKFELAPEDDPVYSAFAALLIKIARDSNAPAQLSGFDAIAKFAETAPPPLIRKLSTDIGKAIAEKGMNGRPVNKKRAAAALIMFVGADAGDVVIPAFAAAGVKSRTPKVVTATADTMREALSTYGSTAMPCKVILGHIPTLFAHSNEQVRNAGKELSVELHLWIGKPVRGALKGAKDVIIKELEAIFDKAEEKKEKPKPKELTRAKQERVRNTGEASSEEDSGAEGAGVEEEDDDEFVEEINLTEKLEGLKIEYEQGEEKIKADWGTAMDSKQWSARKTALDTAINIVGDLKLTPGPHAEIVPRLRKILAKDANINVTAAAAKLITGMANGMRKDFPPGAAKALTVDLMLRLKEKKSVLIDAVHTALDTLHLKKCIQLVQMGEEVTAAAGKKSPQARLQLLKWLERCFKKGMSPADMKGPTLKAFGGLLLKATDDSSGDVRDAALAAISALQVLAGDRNVASLLDKLDQKRKDKVAAGVKLVLEERKKNGVPEPEKKEKKPKAAKKKKSMGDSDAGPSKPKSKKPAAKKPPKPAVYVSDDEGESPFAPDAILEEAVKIFPEFDTENWAVKSAKGRAACMKSLNELVNAKETLQIGEVNVLLSLLALEPGIRDSSFMVAKEKLELLGTVSEKCVNRMPRKTLRTVLIAAIEKLGDLKCAIVSARILILVAEATSPRFFFEVLVHVAIETTNGRAKLGIVKYASKIVDDFGIPAVKPESVATLVVRLSTNAAPALQKACITLACQTSVRSKTPFKEVLESAGLGSDLVESFESELTKYQTAPDAPTRTRRQFSAVPVESTPTASSSNAEAEKAPTPTKDSPEKKEPSPAKKPEAVEEAEKDASPERPTKIDLKPEAPKEKVRVSIANHFESGDIVKDLKSSNWQTRLDSLHEVEKILKEADNFIEPNVGTDLMPVIKFRLTDSNRNIAAVAHGVAGHIIRAMGPGADLHLKILVPSILSQGCVDIKKNVRAAALANLDAWFETVGLSPLIPYLHRPLATLNSNFRKEYLQWLSPRLAGETGSFSAKDEDLTPLLDSCLACLRDRVAEVRHLAEAILVPVLASVGVQAVENKLQSMTKTARMQLEPIVARHSSSGEMSKAKPVRESLRTPRMSPKTPGRQRPHSVAIPSPRIGPPRRRLGDPPTSARRRPLSTRVGPSASPLSGPKPDLIPNKQRPARAERYLEKRKQAAEKAADGESGAILVAESPEDLATDLKDCVSPELFEKLIAPAIRFQLHLEAMTTIKTGMSDSPEALVSVADVILRWAACRIEDSRTPPTVLSKVAEFVSNVCEVLLSSGAKLSEYEASAVIPAVVGKIGSNRDSVRESMLAALLSIGDVVPEDVMLIFLSGCLRRPIGDRACQEVAAEICQLIDRKCGSGAGLPVGVLPVICTVTYGADESAGRAAASCIAKAHQYFGDDTWTLLGKLTDEQAVIIEQRLAHANATQAVERGTPGGTANPSPGGVSAHHSPGLHHSPIVPHLADIRSEDFRLSIAPEPPTSVLSSIKDVLESRTPARTRPAFGRNANIPQTPALPQGKSSSFAPVVPDGMSTLAFVLQQLESADAQAQQDGLATLYTDLQKTDSELQSETSVLMPNLSRCFINALDRLESSKGTKEDPLILKRFLNALMAFARQPAVIVKLNQAGKERVFNDLLGAMVPDKVPLVDDWIQVRRGVNLVALKMLESSHQNELFSALINVLRDGIKESATADTPFKKARISAKCTLCIKSIAKATEKGYSNCRVDALLRDIDDFLVHNPVLPHKSEITEEQTIAIRLLKTIVDSLIAEIGEGIRSCLRLIPNIQNSQLAKYIDMKLTVKDDAPRRETPRSNATAKSAHGSGQVYLKRLQEIQQRYGLAEPEENATPSAAAAGVAAAAPSRSALKEAEVLPPKPAAAPVAVKDSPTRKENDAVNSAKAETLNKTLALRNRMARLRESRSQPPP